MDGTAGSTSSLRFKNPAWAGLAGWQRHSPIRSSFRFRTQHERGPPETPAGPRYALRQRKLETAESHCMMKYNKARGTSQSPPNLHVLLCFTTWTAPPDKMFRGSFSRGPNHLSRNGFHIS